MSKPARIYTRTGDDGTTGLVGGQRVRKDALRISAYGSVDELSSVVGLARVALAGAITQRKLDAENAIKVATTLDRWLGWTQDVLFNLGSDLATLPADRRSATPVITPADTTALELAIDSAQRDLEPLTNFILPGGSQAGAFLHQARTVARRAERELVTLASEEPVSAEAMRYVNRLSDALFVWSRWINNALAEPEHRWNPKSTPPSDVLPL
ncbi:MAG TPA: cob(I)yrinic acid a,c-diamide adenosyltransferase [Candidatus Baltobacteraceae bacterium]